MKESCKIKISLLKKSTENLENKSNICTGKMKPKVTMRTKKNTYKHKKKFKKLCDCFSSLLLKNIACGTNTLSFKELVKVKTKPKTDNI